MADHDLHPDLPERYQDARLVARGGMGSVFRARDSELDRDVAVKCLDHPGGGSGESGATRASRMLREARATARLSDNRHVVTIYDVGEHAGRPYLAMEWLSGGSLAEQVGRSHDVTWVLDVLAQVADALDAAHVAGLVHRDVKPANVLFDSAGTVKVADFGVVASQLDTEQTMLTQPGSVIGTTGYMAPEQASGEPATAASDGYALGCIAFELLTGSRPFARDSAIAELAAHVSAPIPHARLLAGAPHEEQPELDRVFGRALAKDPDERYPTCGAFVDALADVVRDRDAQVQHTAPTRVVAPAGSSSATADLPTAVMDPGPGWDGPERDGDLGTVESAPRDRGLRSRHGIRLAFVGALLLLVALAIGLGLRGGDDPSSTAGRSDATPSVARTTPERSTRTAAADAADSGGSSSGAGTTSTERSSSSPPAATTPTAPAGTSLSRDDAIALHQRAFELLRAGRFAESLPIAQQALGSLGGVSPYEAYANYNVGANLVGLGRCTEAGPFLDRSEQLQGHRAEIDQARATCGSTSDADAGKPGKRAKGRKDHKD